MAPDLKTVEDLKSTAMFLKIPTTIQRAVYTGPYQDGKLIP